MDWNEIGYLIFQVLTCFLCLFLIWKVKITHRAKPMFCLSLLKRNHTIIHHMTSYKHYCTIQVRMGWNKNLSQSWHCWWVCFLSIVKCWPNLQSWTAHFHTKFAVRTAERIRLRPSRPFQLGSYLSLEMQHYWAPTAAAAPFPGNLENKHNLIENYSDWSLIVKSKDCRKGKLYWLIYWWRFCPYVD